jgi:hypothetical protein
MKRKRLTPRQRVANHLMKLGYELNDDDIHFVHGGAHKRLNDTIECWSLFCFDPSGKKVEIQSGHTLTDCAAGFDLVPNTPNSDLYGDLIVVINKQP